MPQPDAYVRQRDFTEFSANYPTAQQSGAWLDEEFDAVKHSMDDTQDRLELIQRDDGQVANLSIGLDQLKPEVVLGVPTDWVTATAYTAKAVVWESDILYVCNTDHTSGVFATDLGAGKWTAYLDYADPLGDAEAAATAAEAAQAAAETAQAASEAAQLLAEAAQAAAEAAQAAAEAAQDSLTLPLAVVEGGHGATTASQGVLNLGWTAFSAPLRLAANLAAYITALGGAAAVRSGLSLGDAATGTIGAQVQGYDVDTAKTDVVQTWTAAQTLPNTGLKVLDTDGSHALSIIPGSNLTAARNFTLTTGDANRTLNVSAADVTISAFIATLTDDADAATARTTLDAARLGGTNSFTGKQTINVTGEGLRVGSTGVDSNNYLAIGNDARQYNLGIDGGAADRMYAYDSVVAQVLWELRDGDMRAYFSGTSQDVNSIGARGFGALQTLTTATTFALAQNGQLVQQNSGSSRVQTIPTNASVAFPIANTAIPVENIGAGTMVLTPDVGVTLLNESGVSGAVILNQWHAGVLYKDGTNTWKYRGSHA